MSIYPVWAEIYLNAIAHNMKEMRRVTSPGAMVMAVVKANGYGHGAVQVSRVALANGAAWLGVARVAEGVALREAGIEAPVLVLGYTAPAQAADAVRHDLAQAVYSTEMGRMMAAAAGKEGRRAKVHIKIDTGMGRLGWQAAPPAVDEVLALAREANLEIEGVFSHFAAADSADKAYTRRQYEQFLALTEDLRRNGLQPLRHIANSPAIIDLPETHLDMVRAGISLYGLYPSDEVEKARVALIPAMSLKAQVAQVKKVLAGCKISYGCTYTTERETVIATLPVGYADGYPRLLSSKGEVLLRGRRAPVVGRVCMDQIMVDAGHIPGLAPGEEAVLFGRQGGEEISADEMAEKLGTINYEVVCMVSCRVPREYTGTAGTAGWPAEV